MEFGPVIQQDVLENILVTTTTIPAVFLALAVIFTAVRVYVRAIILRNVGADDYFIFITLAAFVCQCGFLIYIVWRIRYTDYMIVKNLANLMQYVVVEFAFYLLTTFFLKISLALFFLRIVLERWQRLIVIGSTTVFCTFTSAMFLLALFDCGDPKFYLFRAFTTHCGQWTMMGPMNYTQGVMNAVMDWTFVALPLLVIRKANMRRRDKWSVVLVLCIGAFGSIASIVRLFYIETLHPKEPNARSFIAGAHKIAITSIVEPGLGIMAVCMATMKPLIKRSKSALPTQNKTSTSEIGLATPQSRAPGEFAAYGMGHDEEMQEKSEPVVVRTISLDWADVTIRRGSAAMVAELEAAKRAYDDRTRNSRGHGRIDCLLPDVDEG